MSISTRVLVVALATAVAVGPATAASAGGPGKSKGKASVSTSDHGKKHGESRKAAARARFTVPGVVATTPGAASLKIARKERGVTVVREFVLAPKAVIKRNGKRVSLAAVRSSDRVVAKGARIDGRLVVAVLKVEGRRAPAAPVAPADDSAPATVPVSTPPATIVI